ncbi:hypothetical protein [Flavobacterium sp. RSSB_23]|uniref:hypothetical protein n=1 Tax=Flavobacterium sp. RSSB_23 TaxID=3447668 RepID=UPI003F3AC589
MKINSGRRKISFMRVYFILLFSINAFAQVKDVSKMSAVEKKKELIETLEWLQSKTGEAFKFKTGHGDWIYSELHFNYDNPNELQFSTYSNDKLYRVDRFNLKDIYKVESYTSGLKNFSNSLHFTTYEQQRLINLEENGEFFTTNIAKIYYDQSISFERTNKAMNYLLKLSGGGKKILKEKF